MDLTGRTGSSVTYIPTAWNAKANAAGKNAIVINIGKSPRANKPKAIAIIVQQIPAHTRTVSERVNTPARAQKLKHIAGAAKKNINVTANNGLAPTTIDAIAQILSHGAGGIAGPKPSSGTHAPIAEFHS